MQISVFYDHITQARQQTGSGLLQLLEMCRSWGIEGLEINYTQLQRGGLRLRQQFRRAGMSISCIYEFYDFTHNADLRQAKKHIDLAAKVGAGKVLIVPGVLEEQEAGELEACCTGRGPESGDTDNSKYEAVTRYMESHASTCRVRDALRELVDYGQQKGVWITLEDFDGHTSPCARMLPLKWLMEQVPGLGFALDMGNFAYSDEDVVEAYELLKGYIVHVHCKDRGIEENYRLKRSHCQGLACVPTGGGYLPIKELVMQLKSRGYGGYLAIEHFDAPDQVDYIRRSAEFLRTVI